MAGGNEIIGNNIQKISKIYIIYSYMVLLIAHERRIYIKEFLFSLEENGRKMMLNLPVNHH